MSRNSIVRFDDLPREIPFKALKDMILVIDGKRT